MPMVVQRERTTRRRGARPRRNARPRTGTQSGRPAPLRGRRRVLLARRTTRPGVLGGLHPGCPDGRLQWRAGDELGRSIAARWTHWSPGASALSPPRARSSWSGLTLQHHTAPDHREREEERLLDLLGLSADADKPAGELSHGQQQWLEIGIAVARQIATTVTVLHLDQTFARGSVEEIVADQRVAEIYLGVPHAA